MPDPTLDRATPTLAALDRGSRRPLSAQVYGRFRGHILSGRLRPGTRLPSTRDVARELGASRNVVIAAFEQLAAEGFVDTRHGSGTFVAGGAAFTPQPMPALRPIEPVGFRPLRSDIVDFRSGLPDLARFPVATWLRLTREVWSRIRPRDLAYSEPEGRPELREAIAGYIGTHRGVVCHPDQIVITAGTTQAIGILGRLLLRGPRRDALVEDPITRDIPLIIRGAGGRIVPVPVDEHGLVTARLPATSRTAGLVYVTPSHQFPLGMTMPIQRRVLLLEAARRCGAWVIEDDYDSEFRYESPPLEAIHGLDPGRVVYVGTFSKTLYPAIRIGYVVLPPSLVARGRAAKWFTDLHNSSVEQLVLARFVRDGHFVRHVRAMKRIHGRLREVLVDALASRFGGRAVVIGNAAGLHLCVRFPGALVDPGTLVAIEKAGARVYPVEEHAIRKGRWRDTAILGYGMLTPPRIREGVAAIARGLERGRPGRGGRAAL